MLPVSNWLSDHPLVLKGEVQMALILGMLDRHLPQPPHPPPKKKDARQATSPSPPPPKKHARQKTSPSPSPPPKKKHARKAASQSSSPLHPPQKKSTNGYEFQKDFITNPLSHKNIINRIYLQITFPMLLVRTN